jgi:hypothetical protein
MVSIVGSLLLVVVALFLFFDFIQPEFSSVANLKGQIAGENDFLQTETKTVTAVQNVITEYQKQGGNQGNVALAIPAGQDVAGALAQVYGIAQINSVTIQSISVSAPTLQTQTKTASSTNTVKPLGSYTLQIGGSGTYEALKNFLFGLETNIRIFDVKGLSIAPATVAGSNPGRGAVPQDLFSYNITATTYYQTN